MSGLLRCGPPREGTGDAFVCAFSFNIFFQYTRYRMGFSTYADLSCASDKLCSLSAEIVQLLVPRTEPTALGGFVPLAKSTVLGGLVPRTEHAALGGLPLTSTAVHDFRTHERRIRIGSLSAPPGRPVARNDRG